jgi:dihydroflavonol-4-reductase
VGTEERRVFLTGATGFIGRHVLHALRAEGYGVRALVRRPGDTVEGAEPVLGDLRRPGELVPALRGCRYLVHCAALYSFTPADRAELRAVNVAGTAGLLEAARVAGVERAVVTSSSATVGPARSGGRPATEHDHAPLGHGSGYHRSKVEQEYAALAARVPAVLVLPTMPIGPGDWKPTPTGRLILDFARGRIFAAPPGGGCNLVAVEDVARAHILALERGRPRERYLVGGDNMSFGDLWRALGDATGRRVPRRRIPYRLAVALGFADEARCRLRPRSVPRIPLEGVRMSAERMYVDSTKARAELGYAPGPVYPALERAVAWYRTEGYVS